MDNLNKSNFSNDDIDKPIPFEDDTSYTPINIDRGQKSAGESMKISPKKTGQNLAAGDRITGVKTFFTKLHPGAIGFLDEQITTWLKANPDVSVKRTNVITGDIQEKRTEPNIIITVWY